MMGFARKNDAATSNVAIRTFFIPLHILYAVLLLWGITHDAMGRCDENGRTYPRIFMIQYTLFFVTYAGFMYLHYMDYFMKWHENIKDIDMKDEAAMESLTDHDDRRRLRVRMIFKAQSDRFKCFFTWLIALTVLALVIVTWAIKKDGGNDVVCAPDGDHWLFRECSARFLVQFLHVFTTMQCAAMARVIFIKSVKKVQESKSFVRMTTKVEMKNAVDGKAEGGYYRPQITMHVSPNTSGDETDKLRTDEEDDGFESQKY